MIDPQSIRPRRGARLQEYRQQMPFRLSIEGLCANEVFGSFYKFDLDAPNGMYADIYATAITRSPNGVYTLENIHSKQGTLLESTIKVDPVSNLILPTSHHPAANVVEGFLVAPQDVLNPDDLLRTAASLPVAELARHS